MNKKIMELLKNEVTNIKETLYQYNENGDNIKKIVIENNEIIEVIDNTYNLKGLKIKTLSTNLDKETKTTTMNKLTYVYDNNGHLSRIATNGVVTTEEIHAQDGKLLKSVNGHITTLYTYDDKNRELGYVTFVNNKKILECNKEYKDNILISNITNYNEDGTTTKSIFHFKDNEIIYSSRNGVVLHEKIYDDNNRLIEYKYLSLNILYHNIYEYINETDYVVKTIKTIDGKQIGFESEKIFKKEGNIATYELKEPREEHIDINTTISEFDENGNQIAFVFMYNNKVTGYILSEYLNDKLIRTIQVSKNI